MILMNGEVVVSCVLDQYNNLRAVTNYGAVWELREYEDELINPDILNGWRSDNGPTWVRIVNHVKGLKT